MRITRRSHHQQIKTSPNFLFRVIFCLLGTSILATVLYLIFRYDFSASGLILPDKIQALITVKPQLDFISDISGFLGVVIGLAVPFGINIIQDISSYYSGSRVIKQRLRDEWQMKWLVPIFIVTVFFSLSARLFLNDSFADFDLLRAITYTMYLNTLVGIVVFARYIDRLYLYSFDQKQLRREIQVDIDRAIGISSQPQYINSIEAFGDIALTETKSNSEAVLRDDLPYLEGIVMRIATHDERFILSRDFFELYERESSRPKAIVGSLDESNTEVQDSQVPESGKIDYKKEAQFRLFFNPSEYLVTYRNTLQQITRIHHAGITQENDELSRNSVYLLIRILNQLCKLPDKSMLIEFLLQQIHYTTERATQANDGSMYAAATHWYVDVVFNKYNRGEEGFRLEYLNIFDKYLRAVARFMIRGNQRSLFDALISYLVDGTHLTAGHNDTWKLGHLLMNKDLTKYRSLSDETREEIEQFTADLDSALSQITSNEELTTWIDRLSELNQLLRPHLDKELQTEAEKLYNRLVSTATDIYKNNNLREQIFGVGAFCIFVKKYDYLKQILDYNQPPDSDAVWVGDDIQPTKPSDVVNFYFRRGSLERRIEFGEGHHGSGLYVRKYFLLLLLRSLRNNPAEQIRLNNDLTPHALSGIDYLISGLKQTAEDIKQQPELINVLDIKPSFIDEHLQTALDNISGQAKQKLSEIEKTQGISQLKVLAFKNELLKGFNESAVLRKVFEQTNSFSDQSGNEYKGDIKQYGISQIDDKSVFFEEWYVSYGEWGEHYGNDIGISENKLLYNLLSERCITKKMPLDDAVNLYKEPLILTSEMASYKYFESRLQNFIPAWRESKIKTPMKKILGFAGVYVLNGKEIPVFEVIRGDIKENEVLIFDGSKIGQLVQYSPLSKEFTSDEQIGQFVVSVKAFSSDTVLLEKFLSKPPKWLEGIGDKDAQEMHLKNKVLIRVYERFELQTTNTQIGIRLLVNSSETK